MEDWLAYIDTLYSREIDLGLSRIIALAEKLSLRNFSCPVITVAGTNGKGSVIKFLESIYLTAGYRVAAYTSPHLLQFNERLRINGNAVANEVLVSAFSFIEKNRDNQPLSFFEFTTLAIFYICKKQPLDILLLEIGLGGRLDAVNIVEPSVAVISNIDIDHTDWLGKDRESIGREKAGIIRWHKLIVCGDPKPPQSVYETAKKLEAPFFQFEIDFFAKVDDGMWKWQGPETFFEKLPLPDLKIQNAATSLMALHCLQRCLPLSLDAIRDGINKATLPGRFECVQIPVSIIFDVAHNPQATRYLAEKLQKTKHAGQTLAVVGILQDKDIKGIFESMLSCVDQWYIGGLQEEARGATGESLMEVLVEYRGVDSVKTCYNFVSVTEAFKRALNNCRLQDRIVVFGSFHTVGIVKQYLSSIHQRK
ncbi:bifunctional tetrahydrofolate synthase/dihydrofolate synthase [Coxiella endosymbiont of Amblyomma nuttalli]|uniref:bifunctional tetrahydrofolate synthase/dihydrofolate synthase n=1 Tax=Coxiella endosymbiont of Amblyomma nuttalli TaxID=2749996 RepID=UPI001BADBC71|nr:bifunctional tetrahydrofolate synthase/dihydrofolate synthase [Coxiella endosymbiont of Amblyomma nuttalli]QTS84088.1 Bifunctional protein FolC [Coxiella endosymbiont of Amblyomma nuttalli]